MSQLTEKQRSLLQAALSYARSNLDDINDAFDSDHTEDDINQLVDMAPALENVHAITSDQAIVAICRNKGYDPDEIGWPGADATHVDIVADHIDDAFAEIEDALSEWDEISDEDEETEDDNG